MEQPYVKCQRNLQDLLRAQYPLIFLRSPEEKRAINCAIAAHLAILDDNGIKDGELARWNSIGGFQRRLTIEGDSQKVSWQSLKKASDSQEDLDLIGSALKCLQLRLKELAITNPDCQHTYLLPDWCTLIEPDCHLIARLLKELVLTIEQTRPRPRMSLIIVGTDWTIPTILRNQVHIEDLPLPTDDELYKNVFSVAEEKYNVSSEDARRFSEQAQGMSLQAAVQTCKLANVRTLWEEPDELGQLLLEVKKQEIRKTGVLEYFSPQGNGLEDVGGLEKIKEWIDNRQKWFEQDYRPELRPRAILLEGYPGCGKSFIAKAIAQEWRVPQINFEISRLQSKWVGESESKTFQALRAIEASAPNILFMDEIEKAFSGVGGDSTGVTTRQFGTFLSWLNDHNFPIFFIATSNNRDELPPELFRAGRFDEVFVVMPPNTQERRNILEKRAEAYQISSVEPGILEYLVNNSLGFSGAELDKLVKEAVYLAGLEQTITESHWTQALKLIKPQYRIPKMQKLLRKYIRLLEEGGGKSASEEEVGFWESLSAVES